MRFRLILCVLLFSDGLLAQDTIRLMQYNLLMFGNNFGGCNTSNNSVNSKINYLKTIVDYIQPDMLLVNEISEDESYHDLILNDVFNAGGMGFWMRGSPANFAGSSIVNEVFFRTDLFELINYVSVQTNVRDIDIFRFHLISGSTSGEPTELNCAVAHLKAGNSPEDASERAYETNKLMNYLNNSGAEGNYTFSGDFNLYSASEQAFQNLLNFVNPDVRFYDPISQIGNWNNNSFFSGIHTQSTHLDGDCASGGGLDDRFDFFLVSDEILEGNLKIKYLEGSYQAVGQDGLHFNQALTAAPVNTSVPGNVLNALYGMSDHLPVVIDLVVNNQLGTVTPFAPGFDFTIHKTLGELITIRVSDRKPTEYVIRVVNLMGQTIICETIKSGNLSSIDLRLPRLEPGLYVISLTSDQGFTVARKFHHR